MSGIALRQVLGRVQEDCGLVRSLRLVLRTSLVSEWQSLVTAAARNLPPLLLFFLSLPLLCLPLARGSSIVHSTCLSFVLLHSCSILFLGLKLYYLF